MKSSADMRPGRDGALLSIGQAAEQFGLATHVLRHWESMGLLSPARVEAGRRRYGTGDLYRIVVIMRAKEAGFGLDDIREMIATPDPAARRAILRRHRADLLRRIAQAQTSLDLIECALACDHEDFTQCTDFQSLAAARMRGKEPEGTQTRSSGRTVSPSSNGQVTRTVGHRG